MTKLSGLLRKEKLMPPETKPTISSLAEMTCENCVYLIRGEELIINPGQSDEHTVNRADCYLDNYDGRRM